MTEIHGTPTVTTVDQIITLCQTANIIKGSNVTLFFVLDIKRLTAGTTTQHEKIGKECQSDQSDNICIKHTFELTRDYYHKKKDTDNYKKYRNLTNKLIRSSKSKYFMEAINNDKTVKTLWRHLKDLNSTTDHDIDMVTYEDKNLTDKIDIVNCLNDHFSSVGEKLIPHPHSNFESEKINNYVKSKN
ncbi:unnamed protein product [Mytilus coruscus]|uniref:Uncharacterized protein n=1 Tax=Mytilus coruscus TaxID=42192 RepID=A0A6J8CQ89_MYTCO|nr:unnamed protein product [Mytilus coruscus]